MKFEHAAESLRTGFYKVSHPSQFNDPFECRGNYTNFDEAVRRYVHKNFERLKFEAIRNTNSNTVADQERFTEDFICEVFRQAMADEVNASWLGAIDQTMYIMCFVKERKLTATSDVLFWSHYADSGKGMRITFDMPEAGDDSPYYVREVTYEDKIPEFDCRCMKELFKGAEIVDYLDRLSYTKGSAWSYENEVRMFVPSNLAERDWNGRKYLLKRQSKEGREIDMLRLGHYYTRRVDLGPRVDPECAQRLIDELRTVDETRHIAFWQAKLKPGAYAYTYRKVVRRCEEIGK